MIFGPSAQTSFNLEDHLELKGINTRLDSFGFNDMHREFQEKVPKLEVTNKHPENKELQIDQNKELVQQQQQSQQPQSLLGSFDICERNSTLRSLKADDTRSITTLQIHKKPDKSTELFQLNNILPSEKQQIAGQQQKVTSQLKVLDASISGSFNQVPTLNHSQYSFKGDQCLINEQGSFSNQLKIDETLRKNDQKSEDNSRYSRRIEPKKKIQGQFKLLTSILPKLRKFLEKRTYSGRTRFLSISIRKYINDPADYIKESSKGKVIQLFLKKILGLLVSLFEFLRFNKLPIINPENPVKLLINTLIAAYNLFYLYIMSMEVFFEAKFGPSGEYFNSIALFAWISEMAIQMNTACYHHNHFITDRSIIMRIYLKEYLFFEILPLIFEGRESDSPVLNVLLHLPLLLKIKGMSIILQKLEFYVLQILEKAYTLQLFKLCMKIVLLSHIIACSWYVVAKFEKSAFHEENSWVEELNLARTGESEHELSWQDYYLEALYWAFSQMMQNSVDKPGTDVELAYTSLTMLLSSILFVYLLNSIGAILADIDKQQGDYKKDLNVLNHFMKRKKIDLSLRRRANLNLLKHYQQMSRDKVVQEKEILDKLSGYIQRELLIKSNQKFAKMFPMFHDMFSQETMIKLYSIMEEEVFAPKQVIFNSQKSHYNDSIYLITKGQVLLYIERMDTGLQHQSSLEMELQGKSQNEEMGIQDKENEQRKDIKILKEGECFGTHSFVTGSEKVMNIMTKKFTELIKINRDTFIDILRENKEDYEKFMDLRDRVYIDKNYRKAQGIYCYICGSQDHIMNDCNKIQFDKTNPYIFYNFNRSVDQERDASATRKTYPHMNTIKQQRILSQKARSYQELNDLLGSSDEEFLAESEMNEDDDEDDDEDEGDSQSQEKEKENTKETATNTNNNILNNSNNNPNGVEIPVRSQQRQFSQQQYSSRDMNDQENLSSDMTKSRSFKHHNNSNAANYDKHRESISNSIADPQSVIGHGMENYMTSLDRIDRENGTDDPSHIPASPMVFRKFPKLEDRVSKQILSQSSVKMKQSSSQRRLPSPQIVANKRSNPDNINNINGDELVLTPTNYQQQQQQAAALAAAYNKPFQVVVSSQVSFQKSQEGRRRVSMRLPPDNFSVAAHEDPMTQQMNIHGGMNNSGNYNNNNNNNQFKRRQSLFSSNLNPMQNNPIPIIEGESFFWKFDKLQDYVFYYPYYNSGSVLKRWNVVHYNRIIKRKKSVKVKTFLTNTKLFPSIAK